MALYVYLTEACREDAVTHGLTEEVRRLQERVEQTQSLSLFDPFPPPYRVKKKLGGRQGRLVAEVREMGEHAVVVFLAVMIRGDRAYESGFAKDPQAYGEKHFSKLVSGDDLRRFLEERTRGSDVPVKANPSDLEYGLLYGVFAHRDDSGSEDLVCETGYWIDCMSKERTAKHLPLFYKPCLDALRHPAGLHRLPLADKPDWGVWARRSEGRLLLIAPFHPGNAAEAEGEARNLDEELAHRDATTVLRSSRRAYPALVLADDELWLDLERDPVANMALSPEESEVLESARRSQDAFPLFINGRAGSGKSTILQYLFADLLFYYLSKMDQAAVKPPIYLTANGELLRTARNFVERLLKSEATFAQLEGPRLVEEHRATIDRAFCEFQPHLLMQLPDEDRRDRFSRDHRVDYTAFRRMWHERFGKEKQALRDFGPDLSWHVIRSYIKGLSSETFLDPEDYAHLPENQITVTHDAFRKVFNRVWDTWYQDKLRDENLWDDQDLARFILDKNLARRIHPAVFCDEAQDFTRIELEILVRQNLFSDRSLRSAELGRVPFAFAGDPFQTLNPTGFRWDAVKASFAEKFIFEMDPSRRSGRTDLNYRELSYNYRSTQKIVRFSNHVQALRAALFQMSELRPQEPWASEPRSFPVVWFRSNDATFWKRFREHGGFVVVVPCGEGEETEYVTNDPVLSEHIPIEEGVPVNVLSAGRAKGQEYPSVLVYGFGAALERDLMVELSGIESSSISDPDRSLPMQYFINRLYVAVSRPKYRLVIVDSEEGFARLWECARDEARESTLLGCSKNGPAIWGGHVEGMAVGKPEELGQDAPIDPLENAKVFEADGLARQDAFLLRQAALAYRSGGNNPRARECRARALEFEGDLVAAGDAFFEAGLADDGLGCYWRSGPEGWQRLEQRAAEYPQLRNEMEFLFATTASQQATSVQILKVLQRFVGRLDDESFLLTCREQPVWGEALTRMLRRLSEQERALGDVLGQLVALLDRIRIEGVPLPPEPTARFFYLAQRYPEAIALWDLLGGARPQEYYRARAALEPYPDRLLTLRKANLTEEVLNCYSESPATPLTAEQASVVFEALRSVGRSAEAYEVAWASGDANLVFRAALGAHREGDRGPAGAALQAGVILLVRSAQWETLARFVERLDFVPAADWSDKKVKDWVESQRETLQMVLVRALARPHDLGEAPSHLQKRISDFLQGFLRIKGGKWRESLTIREAGAAFERGGRFTDAISFYEAVIKDRPSKDDAALARERWLACKKRQLAYELTQGGGGKARKIEQEIRMEAARFRIRLDGIPEFPALPELDRPLPEPAEPRPAGQAGLEGAAAEPGGAIPESEVPPTVPMEMEAALPDQVTLQLGDLKLELSRKIGRINITHAHSMETAYLKIRDQKCGGEVDFSSDGDGHWTCLPWGLSVTFPEAPEETVALDLGDLGVQVRLSP